MKATVTLVDIAVNFTDPVFRGFDHKGKHIHEDDFQLMLDRAIAAQVTKMIVTGTSLSQSKEAIALCRQFPDHLRCSVGVHPAHCTDFTSEGSERHLADLVKLVEDNRDMVIAVGEIGLDYAELKMCPRDVQHQCFRLQLAAYDSLGLPFIFHSRDCGTFFVDALSDYVAHRERSLPLRGVIHSFNGTQEEQDALLSMGFYLSLNGSAFRTEELALQVAKIPVNRLLFETDAPWCDVRKKDFGYRFITPNTNCAPKGKFVLGKCVERRNEPSLLGQIVEEFLGSQSMALQRGVIAGEPLSHDELIEQVFINYTALFHWNQ